VVARAVEVETTDELVIAGRVVDRREHRPIVGALVAARVSANGRTKPFKQAVTTDADGGFAFTTTAQEWTQKLRGDFVYFRIAFGDPLRTVDTRDSRRWQPPGPAGTFEIYVDNVLPRRLAGTVTDWRGRPGEGLTVAAERDGQVLGSALTDAAGRYDLEFPGEASPLEAAVYSGAGELLARSGVRDGGGVRLTRNVKLPRPVDSLAALSAALAEPLPQRLLAALAEAGLDTLAALRAAGGVPAGLAGEDAARLNRIVALSVVDAPPTDLAALADAGVRTLTDLAWRPPDELARLLAPRVAPDRVENYRWRAGGALAELANRIIEKRLDPGTPTPVSGDFAGLFRISCDCGCTAANGPQAYLAHLLRFAVAVVRYNGAAIDIGFLQDRFRQPLRDLPATCDTAEHEVAQARIAVEILRRHLAGLGNAAAASASPAWYGEAAYLELLQYLDLGYDELRKVSRRPAAERARFTFQHGLGTDPTDSGPFDDLYRDLAAPAGSGREPSEDWLEGFFGLRSTLADPLRPDGPDARALELRRARLRAGWVEADAAATRPLGRVPLVDPDLVSELDLVDRTPGPATDDVPTWRPLDFLARRRRELQVAEALIASWLSPNPLRATAQQYKDLLLDLTTAQGFLPGSAIPVPPYGFSAGGRALDYLRMKGLRDDAAGGLDVSADLDASAISLEDVQAIVGFVEVLEQNLPVTADERLRIGRILLAHVKRAGFWPVWLDQEAVNARDPHGRLALEPGKFRLRVLAGEAPDPAWTASPPLAESAERQAWEDVLRSRTSAIEALSGDLADRIRAVEARLLPQLRDQLIVSSQPAGVTLLRTTDALTDHYQVDFAAGPCQRTTRPSQAIETVQGLLFSARNGLFDEPGWTLAIDEFDAVWRWLGTFETWSAAITAFLFCDLLRPSLRGDPSPGFSAALEQMRDADPIGPADAAAAYETFAGYLNDVAALEPLAWIELPLATAGHSATLLVGATAGSGARRFYWSLAIEQPDGAGDQGWWRRLEPMDGVDDVAGGARCGAYAVILTASTLATTRSLDLWRLPLPGPDGSDGALLAAAPEWEGPVGLELPDGVDSFLSVSLDGGGMVTIEADETTTYTRPLDRDGRSWAGRFRTTRPDTLWRRYRESDDYGVTPANQSTFACQGDGLLHSVPDDHFVLTADVDADGADELVAFGGADGFWALKMVAVGPYAAWLPLGARPLTRRYDAALGDASHKLFFTVHGDFDGDGAQEIAAFVEADPQPGVGGITTTWMALYVRKWVAATAAWSELGGRGAGTDGQLLVRADRLDPRACAVGRFTQPRRDEILVAYHDHSSAGEVTDLQVYGLVGGAWQPVADAQASISDFVPAGTGLSGGAICAGRVVAGETDTLLMEQRGAAGLATGRFWTLQFRAGRWRRLADLDAGLVSGVPQLLAADFDGDGVDEVAGTDGANRIRFCKYEASVWTPVRTVTMPAAVEHWTAGDFEDTGAAYVIAACTNDPTAGVPARMEALPGAEQQPDLTLGSAVPARAVVSGRFAGARQAPALATLGEGCTFYVQAKAKRVVSAATPGILRYKPYLSRRYRLDRDDGAFALVDPADLAAASQEAFDANRGNRPRNQEYLEEAFYFLPVEVALRLQSAGSYPIARDWLQLVARTAGPTLNEGSRFLALAAAGALASTVRGEFDPLDAHAVARRRAGAYNRYTRSAWVRLLVDYADSEFALATTTTSLALARELYLSGLGLADGLAGAFETGGCAREIAALAADVAATPGLAQLVPDLRALSEINDVLHLNQVIADIRQIVADGRPADEIAAAITTVLQAALAAPEPEPTLAERVADEIAIEIPAQLAVIAGGDGRLSQLRGAAAASAAALPQLSFCLPAQTQQLELRRRIELALARLRNCLDIAGNELHVTPVGAEASAPATTGPVLPAWQPLPYRYETLVERAKQLLEIARQLEATTLNYVESAQRKHYDVLSARRDLAIANATERLKAVQVDQAAQELDSAALQRDRAQDQVDQWSQLLRAGLNQWETAGVAAQWISFGLKQSAAVATTIKYSASPEGWVSDAVTYGAEPSAAIADAVAKASDAFATAAHTQADYERRAQTWAQNQQIALRDKQIANQNMAVASTRLQGTQIDQQIAGLQAAFASQQVTTLTTRDIANEALYESLSGVNLTGYRYFVQQATQLARAAEAQLSFERQEAPQGLIKRDYLSALHQESSPDVSSVANASDSLRSLTGAANLLRDLYQLDQSAFLRNRRKHQLTETISLAQLDPLAFAQLAATGRMAFETPMEFLDQRQPGHYHRLIRRVRVTVIALAPPSVGIRGTLSNNGVSRVVIGDGDAFTTVTLRRGYEEMALTEAVNASDAFAVDNQPELRNTFEGSGIDTHWVLDLPRPANPFDFASLSDVQVTFDYTALSSPALRIKVIAALPGRRGGARVFSLCNEFPDAWYDLANPSTPGAAVDTHLAVRRSDFPPNLGALRLRQIALAALFKGAVVPLDIDALEFTPASTGAVLAGGAARLDDSGVVSTRYANGAGWGAIVSGATAVEPIGDWRLRFAAPAVAEFTAGDVEDVLFTLAFDGQVPPWP
jgi:hypothetical protein